MYAGPRQPVSGHEDELGMWPPRWAGGAAMLTLSMILAVTTLIVLPVSTAADGPSCTDTWTGTAGNGLWQTAGNWSTSTVPSSEDVVCIAAGTTVQVSGSNQASSLQDEGTLEISAGSLELLDTTTSEVSTVGGLSLSGGTLEIAGELDVSGSLATSGGATIAGQGKLLVKPGVNSSLGSGCSYLALNGATLVNEGTLTWGSPGGTTDGAIMMQNGAQLRNKGTFNDDSYDPGCGYGYGGSSFDDGGGTAPSIVNTGTFIADTGSNIYNVEVPFESEGTVEAKSGTLQFSAGGSGKDGTWAATAESVLTFTGGSYALAGDTWSGAGTISVAGAGLTAEGLHAEGANVSVSGGALAVPEGSTSTVGALSLSGGALSLSGELDVSASLASSGGVSVDGSGKLVVESGVNSSLGSNCSYLALNEATLVNHGTLTLGSPGGSTDGAIMMQNGAQMQNTGTFNDDSYDPGCGYGYGGSSFDDGGGAAPSIVNTGTFTADTGSNTYDIEVPFNNEGTIEAKSGTLQLSGGGSGNASIWKDASGATVTFTGGFYTLAGDTWSGAGTISVAGAGVTAEGLKAEAANVSLSNGALTIPAATTSTVGELSLSGGALSLAGELDVSRGLATSGGMTIDGPGELVVGSGVNSSLGSNCSYLALNGATLVNHGTLTWGSSGGSTDGAIMMQNGAQLENTGTFNDDSYDPGCGYGYGGTSINDGGGAASGIENTGTFTVEAGSNTYNVQAPFNNEGKVEAKTGTLQFSGGGIAERVATGTWSVQSGAEILLTGGTFLIGEAVDLSAVTIAGATIEREATSGPPKGHLDQLPFASKTVTLTGTGKSIGTGFSTATIEVTPAGQSEWQALCSALTPALGGEFSCSWDTSSGVYPDGSYEARAQLSDSSEPPNVAPTAAITVLVDNTPPAGTLSTPEYLGASSTVTGTATDSGSGVASWQLQISPAGSTEWSNACPAQTTPTSGDGYQCTVDASSYSDGTARLQAVITDNAGNTYTTSVSESTVDDTPPTGTLAKPTDASYVRGSLALQGTASDPTAGVASWSVQIAPTGTESWASACPEQTAPTSGSAYGCSLETASFSDGEYILRAVIVDNAGNSYTTATQSIGIDNTPPAGTLNGLGRYSSGTIDVTGPATDTGSGVASWQLQITPNGQSTWQNECMAQILPSEGDDYGCALDTTELADGRYQMHAVITDNAGNTYTTPSISTFIDNTVSGESTCTDTWTGGADDGSWDTASNWSTGAVPAANDVACIGPGETVNVTAGTNHVSSIEDEGTLVISGGSLSLTEASESSSVHVLSIQGGSLAGSGSLDVSGSLSWTGGTMSGSGSTVLEVGATGTINPGSGGSVALTERTMSNHGTLTLESGSVEGRSSAELDNSGTFNANADVPGSEYSYYGLLNSDGSNVWLRNTGTINKTAGGEYTQIQFQIDNEGIVEDETGQIIFTGGGHNGEASSGSWHAREGASLAFNNGSFLLGSNVQINGTVFLSGGHIQAGDIQGNANMLLWANGSTLELTDPLTPSHVASLEQYPNTTLTGEAPLDISGSLSWTGGTMTGSGSTGLEPGATGTIDPGSNDWVALSERTLNNQGTLTWSNGTVYGEEGATIDNSGTFNANGENPYGSWFSSGLLRGGGATPTIMNTGTLAKTAGSGVSVIQFAVQNEGIVKTTSEGQLNLSGGGAGHENTGSWQAPASTPWASGIAFSAGSFSLGSYIQMSGSIATTGANIEAGDIQGPNATFWLWNSNGSLELTDGSTPSHFATLNMQPGTNLRGAGPVDISSAFSWTGGTMSGSAATLLEPGSTGSIEASSGCETMSLTERKLINEGTLTFASGTLLLSNGAQLENKGIFNDNSESSCYGGQIENWGGAAPSILNTGTFQKTTGTGTSTVGVNFGNQGGVEAETGTLALSDGGIPEEVADGSWKVQSAAAIDLTGGTFQIGENVDLSAVQVDGANIERDISPGPPKGTLNPHPYAAGTVSITGTGESRSRGFSAATIEVTPAGQNEWQPLCEPITPELTGEYSCYWSTASGAYPDGSYEARATLTSSDTPPESAATPTITVLVDNTPPTGTVTSPGDLSTESVSGTATDTGSGVASWQLQIAVEGSSSWTNACPAQTTPQSGSTYRCAVETGTYTNGDYQLRAVVTDNAGNTYTTNPVTTAIENITPTNTASPTITGTASSDSTLTASSGSWSGPGPLTYSYQWERCDSAGASCSDISGATSATYLTSESDIGQTIRVIVTASNSAGQATATSGATGIIAGELGFSFQFGHDGSGNGEFHHPADIAIDPAGDLFVLDGGNGRVEEFNNGGTYIKQFATAGSGAGELSDPDGLALDAEGDVWVADTGNRRVVEFNDAGEFVKTIGAGEVGTDEGIAVDRNGDIWVAETNQGRLAVFNSEGERLKTVGSRGSGAGEIGEPEGIAVSPEGDVFVADWSNDRIDEFTEGGAYVREFGASGSASGELNDPYGIAADASGNVWVGEVGNDRVQEFTGDGEYVSHLGSYGSGPGEFSLSYPMGLALDAAGDVWVTDSQNDRIEEWGTPASPSNMTRPSISGTAQTGMTLTASTGSWAGTVPLNYTYQWELCDSSGESCSLISEATGSTYTPIATETGGTLRVAVTATNEMGSAASTSDPTAVVASVPSNAIPPTISGTAQDGQTLTVSTGTWDGTQPLSYTYQWQSCDSLGESCLSVTGATSASYTLAPSDVGDTLEVMVTATNTLGSTTSTSAATMAVAAIAPANTSPPSISGEAVAGLTLRSNTGGWEGTPPLTFTYQWQTCNDSGAECTNIADATERSYGLGNRDVGTTVRVLLTASNSGGSASAASSPSTVVESATPPSDTALPAISGSTHDGQTLTVSPGTWAGTTPTYAYQWESCNAEGGECQEIEGATDQTYTLGAGDLETTLRALVTASNAAGTADAISSASSEIAPGAPAELEAPSISGATDPGEILFADAGEWSGSETQIGYQWESCSPTGSECQDIVGATTEEYSVGEGDLGTTLRVRIGASNELGSVTILSPATAVVGDTPASLVNTSAPTVTGTARVAQTLTADPGSWTGEEPITYAYQWQRCYENASSCENIAGAKAASYVPQSEDVGAVLQVAVTVTDANGSISAITALTQPVAPESAPTVEEAPGISGPPLEGQTLSAMPGVFSGEGPLTYSYRWERCSPDGGECAFIAGATANTYTLTDSDVDSTVELDMIVAGPSGESTGTSTATAVISAAKLVEVSAPSIGGVEETGHPLSADPGIWTGSGPITYTYQWERCNASGEACTPLPEASGASYTPGAEDLGASLRTTVTATAGAETTSSVSAATSAIVSPTTAPEDIDEPAIEGEPTVGDTLSVVPGTWAGAEPISYTYQWQSCSESGEECADITGATEHTYVLTGGDTHATIRVTETATNSIANTSITSSQTEPVGAAGPPTSSKRPTILGTAKEGEKLFVNNGTWGGSRPLSYRYEWERCSSTGESCAEIAGANKPSYPLSSVDVGEKVRVEVTATNSLGAARAQSALTTVYPAGRETATQAIELAEQTDPSILAPSTAVELEEQEIKPELVDSGAELVSEHVLNSATVSKSTSGEFAVGTSEGELGLEPTGAAPDAATLPTIVNGAAAVFAGIAPATDTIVRAEPLGASTLTQLRSAEAPTSLSWAVHLGLSQRLQQLPDGSVAVIETPASSAEEAPPGEEPEASTSTPVEPNGEEGVGPETAEKEQEDYSPEKPLAELPAAPTLSTSETTPKEGELEPQNTQARYESASNAIASAQEEAEANVLMVITPPTARDAAGNPVSTSLSVNGETLTLTIDAGPSAAYPVTSEMQVASQSGQTHAGPFDRRLTVPGMHDDASLASSHSLLYALAGPYNDPTGIEEAGIDPNLKTGPGKLHPTIARTIIPYDTAPKTPTWEALEHWLVAVGDAGLTPYITFGDELGQHEYCTSQKSCQALQPSEQKYGEDVERLMRDFEAGGGGRPPVTIWGAWNEPDLGGTLSAEKHYYAYEPKQAAKLWRYAKAAMLDTDCTGCVMVAGEFAEYKPAKPKFEKEYEEEIVERRNEAVKIGSGPNRYPRKPSIWGLHDYHDLVYYFEHHTNPDAEDFDHALLAKVGKARIWLSEMGVLLTEGSGKETPLETDEEHGKRIADTTLELQAQAANDFLKLGALPDVEMLDYYEYRSRGGFDSALLPPNNAEPAREAYCVLARGEDACPPGTTTGAAIQSAISPTTSTAAVEVNPMGLPTKYWLEYGQTTAYGHETAPSELPNPSGEQSEAVALTGLNACTTYHYQVEAESEANSGAPTLGGDKTFTTSCDPLSQDWEHGLESETPSASNIDPLTGEPDRWLVLPAISGEDEGTADFTQANLGTGFGPLREPSRLSGREESSGPARGGPTPDVIIGYPSEEDENENDWHVQNDPQDISMSSAITPTLVTIPTGDSGSLPAATSGSHVAWFGDSSSGTYCGGFEEISQQPGDGCSSRAVQTGALVSPPFSLQGVTSASLSFESWFEIEAVQPSDYDVMEVDYTTDTGTTEDPFEWHQAIRLNPDSGDDAGADAAAEDYTDNGRETPGTWQEISADLSAATGSPHVRIRFVFDSRDTLYNGFRGWLIDDVHVAD
jgi:sugar lactone lactonase YvrE